MSTGSVLVIEDEYGVRTGIEQILSMEGHTVAAAASAREALEHLCDRSFDVALIDYQLPDVDGLTLLHQIRDKDSLIKTCMITAYANIDTAVAATRQGVDFFLPKPFTPEDLVGVVANLLQRRSIEREAWALRKAHEASLLALASEKSQTHSLVSCMQDAVLVVNRDGEVALVNPSMALLLGVEAEQVVRRPATDVLSSPHLEPLRQQLAAPPERRHVFECEIGEGAYMVSIATFRDEEGTARGSIVTMSDISEVRRLAVEKSRFLRTLVHELRSPLGAIRSMLEVVMDRSLGDELGAYDDFLKRADVRIENLVGLVGELLTLSRIDEQAVGGEPERVVPSEVVRDVLLEYADRAKGRGVRLDCDLPGQDEAMGLGPEELRTVLSNLVGNGIKYNRRGGSVSVRLSRSEGWVHLEVKDTGLGMAKESVPRVFDEFFREKRSETRDVEGNGLGLSIVKRLVQRRGGTIDVASELGAGTTFRVRLPG
jgi:PAS domain S-box-containing protein